MTLSTQHIIHQLRSRINETRRRLYRKEFLHRLLTIYSVLLLVGGIILSLESLVEFNTAVRSIIFYTYWSLAALLMIVFAGKQFLQFAGVLSNHTDEEIARLIGKHFPTVGDRLENTLDLAAMIERNDQFSSRELIEVSLEHFHRSTERINFAEAVSYTGVINNMRIVGAVTVALFVTIIISGSPFAVAAERLWNHNKEYERSLPFTILVEPGDVEIVKGETVSVRARVVPNGTQPVPPEVTLAFAEEGIAVEQRFAVRQDSNKTFSYQFASLKNSLHYKFDVEGISSKQYKVSVTDRPFVRSLSVVITPPAYSQLPRQQLDENVGDIMALAGSNIHWTITSNKEIDKGFIVFKDGSELPLKNRNGEYTASYVVMHPTSYYIELEDTRGITTNTVIEYGIKIIPDAFPTVEILSPGRNIDITEQMTLPMTFKVNDDFGVRRLQLSYRLVQSRFAQAEQNYTNVVLFDTLKLTDGVVDYEWNLSSLGLVPEDVVEYFAEVFDNDNINGPKSGRSQTYLLRLPSLDEVFADADKAHNDALKTMEQALKEAEELKKNVDELSNDLKRNQTMEWQKQKKAEELAKKYEEIQKKVDEVRKQTEELMEHLQNNNALSQETLEKYLELQKVMQQLNSPEFQEAMKRMQQAMQSISPEQMREAIQQAQFSEEQFRKSIERTINLLKRIQVEQKVDEAVKRAQEMMREQEAIQKETEQMKEGDTQKADALARRQEEMNKKLEELQQSLDDVHEKMEEFPKEMPLEQLEEAQRSAGDKQMKEAIKQSVQQLRSQQRQQAAAQQQQALSGMQELSEQLSEVQEQLLNNQMRETMDALRKSMRDLLQLSQQQEQIKNQSRTLDPNSQQFQEVAQRQQSLVGDLANIANALAELSQKSFVVTPEMGKQIGRAMGHMEQAMNSIEQRNGQMVSAQQAEAMAALNKAATLLQGAMQSLQQQGGQGGGSLLQQLRSMAMQQQSINMQTQQLGQQQGLSQQQLQEIGRLARQQEAVRKSLEQLQREAEGNPERNRIMGDLNKIAEDMKEVVEQLQQNNVDPNTVQQQERILSRLLQAQRSLRERDFEQRRKATVGITPSRPSPVQLSQTKDSQLQRDLQRAIDAGYSKEYIELIKKYYEALKNKN